MFLQHVAYRFRNGLVKEFAGSGLTPASARQNGVYFAKAAATSRGERFSIERIVSRSSDGGSAERQRFNARVATGITSRHWSKR